MIRVRKAEDRGHADHGWLNTYHTFSFAGYRDPNFMGFANLRVMNEDRVSPGEGFGTHGHDNMEIISIVLEGQLQHKDSMGNGEVLKAGQVQCISAGRGITHSEFNPSSEEPVHFYQIWLEPNQQDVQPRYQQRAIADDLIENIWHTVASPDGADDEFQIYSDASVQLAKLGKGESLSFLFKEGRSAWLQVLRGSLLVDQRDQENSQQIELSESDGAAISEEEQLSIQATADAFVLLIELYPQR